jgi:hypothetical protein
MPYMPGMPKDKDCTRDELAIAEMYVELKELPEDELEKLWTSAWPGLTKVELDGMREAAALESGEDSVNQ